MEATFHGSEYLTYSLSGRGDPIVSRNDKVFLRFKTRQPNGLLFYTGKSSSPEVSHVSRFGPKFKLSKKY